MSKSNPVLAVVMDESGKLHDIATTYKPTTENVFANVENEAKRRGIKVESVVTVQFPVTEAQ